MNPILGNQGNNGDNMNYYNQYNNYGTGQRNDNLKYNQYRKTNKADITIIIRIFAIILILFGLTMIGESVYALNSEENKQKDNPQVSTEKMGKEVTITINTERPIKEFKYKWNDGEDTTINGDGTIIATTTIDIPNGNNILKITVTDFFGYKTQYYKQYIYESSDIEKPKIDIAVTGNRLKITATDETKISYMTYKWNEDEEKRIEPTDDEKEITQDIDVMQGQNELTIIALDGEENKTTRTEKIIGDNKPEVLISTEGNNILVSAKDDEEITRIEVNIDGQLLDSGEESLGKKEVTAKIPVSSGNHTITATATNINGLQSTKSITASM